jgi:PEGA domain
MNLSAPKIYVIMIAFVWATHGRLEAAPLWASFGKCQESSTTICAVGTSISAVSQDEARTAAWNSALIQLARQQLPFLQSVRESGTESLAETKYSRSSSVDSQDISWAALEEDSKAGSPFMEQEKSGRWAVSVLLRWGKLEAAAESIRLKSAMKASRSVSVVAHIPVGDPSVGVGQLSITTDPAGATVVVGGFTVGTSNAEVNGVGAGTHRIVLNRTGYFPLEDVFTMLPGQKLKKHYQLKKRTKSIHIISSPDSGIVFLNNRASKVRSGEMVTLDYGVVSLRVERAGYFPESKVVNIDEQTETVEFTLLPMPGFVTVFSDVKGADVTIDGRLVGKADLINYLLPGGEHSVQVNKAGYASYQKTIFVNSLSGETVLARPIYIGLVAASQSSNQSSKEDRSKRKYGLWTLAGVFAAGALIVSQQQPATADSGECEKFQDPTSKSKCQQQAVAINDDARAKKTENTQVGGLLAVAAMVSFGFSLRF